jgi:hypothetical protein
MLVIPVHKSWLEKHQSLKQQNRSALSTGGILTEGF